MVNFNLKTLFAPCCVGVLHSFYCIALEGICRAVSLLVMCYFKKSRSPFFGYGFHFSCPLPIHSHAVRKSSKRFTLSHYSAHKNCLCLLNSPETMGERSSISSIFVTKVGGLFVALNLLILVVFDISYHFIIFETLSFRFFYTPFFFFFAFLFLLADS